MQEYPDSHPNEDEDKLDLIEPEIEEEIAHSDEWMQKGLGDSDPPEEDVLERDE
jgi:hypothetical protein